MVFNKNLDNTPEAVAQVNPIKLHKCLYLLVLRDYESDNKSKSENMEAVRRTARG